MSLLGVLYKLKVSLVKENAWMAFYNGWLKFCWWKRLLLIYQGDEKVRGIFSTHPQTTPCGCVRACQCVCCTFHTLRVYSHLWFITRELLRELFDKQECIPVGCVPPAVVAVCWGGVGGVCLSACWDIPPPGVGLETPQPYPSTSPWVWAWRPPPGQTPQPPPLVWAWRPARHAGILPLPLWTEFLTHASENITLPQLRCGR